MDKETLSSYGWIVIAIIIVSSLIMFASDFFEDISNKTEKQAQKILLNISEDDEEDLTLKYDVCETWQCGENLNAYIMKDSSDEELKYRIYIKPITISKNADYSMFDDSSYWKLINTSESESVIKPLGTEFGLEENQGIKYSSVIFESLDFSSRITEIKPILSIWEDDDAVHVEDLSDYTISGNVYTLKINDINLNTKITTIPPSCFAYDTIQNSISAPAVTVLENRSLAYNTNIKTATFGQLKTIEEYAFKYCENLSNFDFDSSITEIKNWAFEECDSLESIKITSKKIHIYECAFSNCDNVKSLNISYNVVNSNIHLDEGFIIGSTNLNEVFLPCGKISCTENLFNLINWNTSSGDVTYYFNGALEDWLLFKENNSISTPEENFVIIFN